MAFLPRLSDDYIVKYRNGIILWISSIILKLLIGQDWTVDHVTIHWVDLFAVEALLWDLDCYECRRAPRLSFVFRASSHSPLVECHWCFLLSRFSWPQSASMRFNFISSSFDVTGTGFSLRILSADSLSRLRPCGTRNVIFGYLMKI